MNNYVCKHDVFISYAHVDDKPLPNVGEGWVSTLVRGLKTLLAQQLGREGAFSLWNDELLSRHQPLTPQILDALEHSATLLVVISPGYLASEWCSREITTFLKIAGQSPSRPKSRVFVVEYDKLDSKSKPEELQDLIGYPFWEEDQKNNLRRLGWPKPNPDKDQLYYDRLLYLARDLEKEIKHHRNAASIQIKNDTYPPVFLAEVTDDLENLRDEVRQYLKLEHIQVLPENISLYSRYLNNEDNLGQALEKELKSCKIFVQLLSEVTGKHPEKQPSFPRFQYDTALRIGKTILQWRDSALDGHDHRFGHSNQQISDLGMQNQPRLETAHIERNPEVAIELTEMRNGKPVIRYFVSYAHDDKDLKDNLLKPLKQRLAIAKDYCFEAWDDGEILAGERWHEQIQAAVARCQFGLLLVSPAFLGSAYIQDHELLAFVASNLAVPETGKRVIPVVLKPMFDKGIDLKGLERLQLFRDSAGRAFEERGTRKTRGDFASELFQQILKIVKRYGAPPHLTESEPYGGAGRNDDQGPLDLNKVTSNDQKDLLNCDTVYTVKLEDFKYEVLKFAKLQSNNQTKKEISIKNSIRKNLVHSNKKLVFINVNKEDRSFGKAISRILKEKGMDCYLPLLEAEPAEFRRDWKLLLVNCNGLIIVYGTVPPGWVRAQLLQGRKIINKRPEPLEAQAICDCPAKEKKSLDIDLSDVIIIDCRNGLKETIFQPFLDALEVQS